MRRRAAIVLVTVLVAAACSSDGDEPARPGDGAPASTVPLAVDIDVAVGVTDDAGNRLVSGTGSVDDVGYVSIETPAPVAWVVGVDVAGVTNWVTVLDDGSIHTHTYEGAPESTELAPAGTHPVAVPPTVTVRGDEIIVATAGGPAYLADDGSVVAVNNGPTGPELASTMLVATSTGAVLFSDILPDGRPVRSDAGIAVLADPTDRFAHGVLGDEIEASSIRLFSVDGTEPGSEATFPVDEDEVIEALAPIAYDLDGDGADEYVVTVSTPSDGTRVTVFDRDGNRVDGPPIGRASRWRHLIGVGPTGPNGEIEIVTVKTPHLGGVLEFWRYDGDDLTLVAEDDDAYPSHVLGSRNLELAVLADLTGDGRPDVVLPSRLGPFLDVITRTDGGTERAGSLEASGELTANVFAMAGPDGISFALGSAEGLRLWRP